MKGMSLRGKKYSLEKLTLTIVMNDEVALFTVPSVHLHVCNPCHKSINRN